MKETTMSVQNMYAGIVIYSDEQIPVIIDTPMGKFIMPQMSTDNFWVSRRRVGKNSWLYIKIQNRVPFIGFTEDSMCPLEFPAEIIYKGLCLKKPRSVSKEIVIQTVKSLQIYILSLSIGQCGGQA